MHSEVLRQANKTKTFPGVPLGARATAVLLHRFNGGAACQPYPGVLLGPLEPWRWRHYVPSKRREPITQVTWPHIPEERIPPRHRLENVETRTVCCLPLKRIFAPPPYYFTVYKNITFNRPCVCSRALLPYTHSGREVRVTVTSVASVAPATKVSTPAKLH
jgi:hypothetical protein